MRATTGLAPCRAPFDHSERHVQGTVQHPLRRQPSTYPDLEIPPCARAPRHHRIGLGTDAGFGTGAAACCSACTDFEIGVGTGAEIGGESGPEAGSATRTSGPVSSRNKSISVRDLPECWPGPVAGVAAVLSNRRDATVFCTTGARVLCNLLPKMLAISLARRSVIRRRPHSRLATKAGLTPNRAANCTCVRCNRRRRWRKSSGDIP